MLYDAVYLAANEKLKGDVGRKAIVVITDGVEPAAKCLATNPSKASQRADSIIYSIFYQDIAAYGGSSAAVAAAMAELQRMSGDTGGRVFRVDRKYTLDDVFKDLQDELRSQYSISYSPTNSKRDGTFRKMDLQAVEQGLQGPDSQRLLRDGARQVDSTGCPGLLPPCVFAIRVQSPDQPGRTRVRRKPRKSCSAS